MLAGLVISCLFVATGPNSGRAYGETTEVALPAVTDSSVTPCDSNGWRSYLGLRAERKTTTGAVCMSSDHGSAGLIDLPSARMQTDATLIAQFSKQPSADTYALTYQLTPWAEASARYHAQRNPGGGLPYYDRSYGLKLRLLREGYVWPQVAIGAKDMLGTGLYAAEYIVASKSLGYLDLSVGLGWGRFSGRSAFSNPLTWFDRRFGERSAATGEGGTLRLTDLFRGPHVGGFGGLQYHIPRWNLTLATEYNPDSYVRETKQGQLSLQAPYSFGVEWRLRSSAALGVSWQHGSELGVRLKLSGETATPTPRKYTTVAWSSANFGSHYVPEHLNLDHWYDRLLLDSERVGLLVRSASIEDGDRAVIEFSNLDYQLYADAIERLSALAEIHLPGFVTRVTLVAEEAGLHPVALTYDRRELWRLAHGEISADFFLEAIRIDAAPGPVSPTWITDYCLPHLTLSPGLGLRFSLFDPDAPLRSQLMAKLGSLWHLASGWTLQGVVSLNLANNFDSIQRESDSELPHVRSDIKEYLQQGQSGIDALILDHHRQISPTVYLRASAGILEEMYMGAGLEGLWRPKDCDLAFGASVYSVRKRAFDKRFGTLDYQAITAHGSIYWAAPFRNYDFALHGGRYLAGDLGATLEITRSFPNGWSVGAFATLTDVPFEAFGEGSFDKGLSFRVPLNFLAPFNSRRVYQTTLHPLTRDGGARLDGYGSALWDLLRDTHPERLDQTLGRVL